MEIPESKRLESKGSGCMGEGEGQRPSVSRGDGDTEKEIAGEEGEPRRQTGGAVQGLEEIKPLKIESVDVSRAGVSSDRDYVDRNSNKATGTSSSSQDAIDGAGPSSQTGITLGEVGSRIDDDDSNLNERSSGAWEGGAGSEKHAEYGDPPRQQQETNDPSSLEGGTAAEVRAAAANSAPGQQFLASSATFGVSSCFPPLNDKYSEAHLIDIPLKMSSKAEELDSFKRFTVPRTLSNFSRTSIESGNGDQCRICQQHTEEPLMELGCHCRGELAKAHLSCVNHWFGNKGTNKCEVCQHVATNVPLPASQPTPHFWVWRVGGPYNSTTRRGQGARFHPLWAALLILIAGLLFDILISIFLGASALPVNIIIGVLVVLGLGTAARLVLECWHERVIRRNIRRMEEEPNLEDFLPVQHNINIQVDPVEGHESSDVPAPSPGGPVVQGSAEASVTASVAATATADVISR